MEWRTLAFALVLLASPALAQEAAPAPDPASPAAAAKPAAESDCEGRNPFHCGVVTQNQEAERADAPQKALRPPGGCEGRNPLYCQEQEPEKVESQEDVKTRKEGRSGRSDSRNNNRKRRKRAQ